ncbi:MULTISPECIES: sulfatase [unclassified Lentimonas]|uniref:sulfatase n=1 Tax=unclassified Lentimonas TaxID=2630993 RepID=UPI0013244E47|nr:MULTISPECIES: sulfatase [unclassified Lentimonas]CAA6692391.1 Choline-sulfatase (EC [Lentimonas sp. CC19]CAA6693959.1 Choline-sulfatase (EC [Lentimonas sp. CC10]CAA7072209.1 Choline-sulfatase (EC [Lentimonas sp. CC11]
MTFKSTLLLTVASLLASQSFAADKPQDQPMNILMIAIDDLNDWVGFLGGHPQAKTPNMDRLAAQSMVFENANCSSVACNPSRSALMSGLPPYVTGLYSNHQKMRSVPALKDAIMIPRYFSNHGYTSMVRGKIFHHADMDEQSWDIMSNQKKDKLKIPKDQQTDMSPYKDIKIDNGLTFVQKPQIAWKSTMQPKELSQDYQNAIWAAQWLTDSADQDTPLPFFLACGIFRPHLPWTVPAEYYARFDLDTIELPPINEDDYSDIKGGPAAEYIDAKERGLLKEITWAYLANVAYADDCVGVLLDALEESPYKDNTIVVLWSDHGWHVGEKMRYKKSTLWEETARMPFLMKVPGAEPGRSIRPINLIDLYPTLIDLAGLPEKADLTGRSFKPLIDNPEMEWNYPSITTSSSGYSLRNERWRYIIKKGGVEELYDHSKDPNEWHNLASNPEYDSVKAAFSKFIPKKQHK